MHTVEAILAAADVLGDEALLERATGVLRFVCDQARGRGWRIAEHYDAHWQVMAHYNLDQPTHPFRPYGATPGFVYTTDFDGVPVVRERMHWVLAEAVGAGSVLARALEEAGDIEAARIWRSRVQEWWGYAQEHLVEAPGRWIHELDRENVRSTRTWTGKPDVYHATQMALLPRLPIAPTFAAALREGLLDS